MVKLKSGEVAEVWLHARLGTGELVTLLSPFVAAGRNVFQQEDPNGARFMPSSAIKCACLYMAESPGKVRVVP